MEDAKRYVIEWLKRSIDYAINGAPKPETDPARLMQGTMELDRMLNEREDDGK